MNILKLKQETAYSVTLDGKHYDVFSYWGNTSMTGYTIQFEGNEVTDSKIILKIQEAIEASEKREK